MTKKSQVTIFIIIGIVALIIMGSYAYISSLKYNKEEQVPPSMSNIKLFVDSCLKDTAESAILLAGVQGGVIYFSDVIPNQETFYSYSTYWYDGGRDTSVSKKFIESEISRYIQGEIGRRCIHDFESFHRNIGTGELSAEAEINEDSVEVKLDYPVTLIEGDTRTMISKFSAEIPVRFGDAIDIADDIVSMEREDPDYIQLSELGNKSMIIIPYKHNDDVIIYSIIDRDNQIKDSDFKLVFANRFEAEKSGNRKPEILNADNIVIINGETAERRFTAFDADNDRLEFSSIGRFKISEDGVLSITPGSDDLGEHSETIIVKDGNGGRDAETIKILVVGA